MKPIDLKLYEIMDEEVDKSVSEGCYYRDIGNTFSKIPPYDNKSSQYLKRKSELPDYGPQQYEYTYIINGKLEINERQILGHYPTHADVLRYVVKKGFHYYDLDIGIMNIMGQNKTHHIEYELDLTQPLQTQTEEQKQELFNFLTEIGNE